MKCSVAECQEKRRAGGMRKKHYNAAYKASNRERVLAKARQKDAAYREAGRAENPDKLVGYQAARRARLTGAGGSYTRAEWEALLDASGHRCRICASDGKLTVDHIVPVSRGGCSNIWNLQPLCGSCNSRKGATFEGCH